MIPFSHHLSPFLDFLQEIHPLRVIALVAASLRRKEFFSLLET